LERRIVWSAGLKAGWPSGLQAAPRSRKYRRPKAAEPAGATTPTLQETPPPEEPEEPEDDLVAALRKAKNRSTRS